MNHACRASLLCLAGCVHPMQPGSVAKMPEVDAQACAHAGYYPPHAEEAGIEGNVAVRVHLDETGRVVTAKVLHGLGYGLDEVAQDALLHSCHFTPAIDKAGHAIPFDLTYTWIFELPQAPMP